MLLPSSLPCTNDVIIGFFFISALALACGAVGIQPIRYVTAHVGLILLPMLNEEDQRVNHNACADPFKRKSVIPLVTDVETETLQRLEPPFDVANSMFRPNSDLDIFRIYVV